MHLSSVDLDLLVVLHALLETQSVTAASGRVGLSRSATSHALGRLREQFDDPLLVRAGRGLVRTPRAEALRPALARWVGDTERLLTVPERFEPASARLSFRLGCNDYSERVIVGAVSPLVARRAPGIDLHAVRAAEAAALRSGSVDVLLGALAVRAPDIVQQPLYQERHVCVLRRDHPALGEPLTPARFAALDHVLVAPGGQPTGIMDLHLRSVGLARRVARSVATFQGAPELVAGSDYVLTVAERLVRPVVERLGLVVVEAPFEVRFPISMAWHRRSDGDEAHGWLRAQLQEAVAP